MANPPNPLSIAAAVEALELDYATVAAMEPDEQFRRVRLAYLTAARTKHPDKVGGGDGAAFRACHEAFERLRDAMRAGEVGLEAAGANAPAPCRA